jgi:hypothetical protein
MVVFTTGSTTPGTPNWEEQTGSELSVRFARLPHRLHGRAAGKMCTWLHLCLYLVYIHLQQRQRALYPSVEETGTLIRRLTGAL